MVEEMKVEAIVTERMGTRFTYKYRGGAKVLVSMTFAELQMWHSDLLTHHPVTGRLYDAASGH